MKILLLLFTLLLYNITYTQDFLGQYNVHGKVTDGLTTQGLGGISVKYIQVTPETDTIETFTDAEGNYSFTITDVENQQSELESKVTFGNGGSKPVVTISSLTEDKADITVFDILGQRIYKQNNYLVPGINSITINIPKVAASVYFATIETSQKLLINKLQLPFNNWGNCATEIFKSRTNIQLKKTEEITFVIEFRDLTEQHYPYLVRNWRAISLVNGYEYNTPLLPKKNLAIPFINPRNNAQVRTTRELLFFERGVDYLLYSAYQPRVRPLLTYLDIQDLPSQYSEQDVRNATLVMLTATNLPLDTLLWKETENYIRPQEAESSTIGYKFEDSSIIGQYDMIINYIISNERQITSLVFEYNKDLIEPNQIGNFIKYSWWYGIAGSGIPKQGYFSYDPRDSIDTMTLDENIIYSNMIQYEDRPTWISDENIPENNLDSSTNYFRNEQDFFYSQENIKTISIGFRKDGSVHIISGERDFNK